MVNDGQPESRIQAWSPVQVSLSTPNRSLTTRFPSLIICAVSGLTRRCRLSWHSPSAMMIFGPRARVVIASRRVLSILAMS